MGLFQSDPPKQPQTPKAKYLDIKKCVMKREVGEISEECAKKFKELGIED